MVFLPECFDYIGKNKEETISMAYEESGKYLKNFRDLAIKNKLWLSLGGFHHVEVSVGGSSKNQNIKNLYNKRKKLFKKFFLIFVFQIEKNI